MTIRSFSVVLLLLATGFCQAQVFKDQHAYETWKRALVQHDRSMATLPAHPATPSTKVGGGCDCWTAPDSSFTTIDSAQWDAAGYADLDDSSYGPIDLPFDFEFYGQSYDQAYININGSISLGAPWSSFTFYTIPNDNYAMIAPFRADVHLKNDSGGVNKVQYKLTSSALFVRWSEVGYFFNHIDKLNSFQVIISDGTDPSIPGGNNVSFCYGPMEWTTGDASGGTDGFGGSPATPAANAGDGLNFLLVGQFDHAGTDWDGTFGNTDGVGWLTGRHFSFSTASDQIAPVFTSADCDTLDATLGSSYNYPGWTVGITSVAAGHQFTAQPNPTYGPITLSWPANLHPSLVQVFGMDGSLVLTAVPKGGSGRMQLDLSQSAPGLYTACLTGSHGTMTVRLVRMADR